MAEYSEMIPFFLMAGDKIVEAFYQRCESDDGETWRFTEGITNIPITARGEGVDRLVAEVPSGCAMIRLGHMNMYPGDTFSLTASATGGGESWERCERPRMAAEEIKQEAVTDGHH